MILTLKKNIHPHEVTNVKSVLRKEGFIIKERIENKQIILGAVGKITHDLDYFQKISGVEKVDKVPIPYKLVSRLIHPDNTLIKVGDVSIGGDRIVMIAGPCAVESREQALTIGREVRKYGAVLFRGGAFKPRTSPYSFQGLEEEGLKILAEVREETGMGVITEMTSVAHADVMMKYVDIVQVGARNMQNFELLKTVGRMGKPVMLKRGLSATIEEWLMSAEYILSEGNDNVILCERGIRTFEPYTRNTLDLSAIPVIKKLTHLPVIIDPSHATGLREKVSPMARAAIAAGADGLIVEVHHDPDNALSDGPQSLYPEQFGQLMRDIYVIAPVVGKQIDFKYLDKAKTVESLRQASGKEKYKTGFLGEMGTFSHKASNQYFGDAVNHVAMPSFKAIFENLKNGEINFGVVPIENSLSGSIHEVYDLLIAYDIKVVGEIILRIMHNLIGHADTKIGDIKRVLSHPVVFGQCRQFLNAHPEWELVSVTDTAKAVETISKNKSKTDAAIANKVAADIYGMQVMEKSIETDPRNFTRFLILGTEEVQKEKKKTSLIYSTNHKPGALYETLKIFAKNNINMVKLESRPIHGKPWEYIFYVDIEADAKKEPFLSILPSLKENTDYFKILGSY